MKNNKTKNTVAFGLIYVILLGVFNLLVFTISKSRNDVFWLSYGFMTLAFVVQSVSLFLSFKSADVETAVFGIMIFQMASLTLALVIQVLVLAVFLIIAIISLLSRDTVQQISDNVKEHVSNLKSVLVDIEMLMDGCTDPELKASLRKLSETVKYSDPISNEAVADVEQRIMRKISELRINIDDNQIADAKQSCADLERLYVERNKKLAISK